MKYLKYSNEIIIEKLDSHQMVVGSYYKITEPVYDDFDEGLQPDPYTVEVIKKMKYGVILRDVNHNFTFERTFAHLMTCEIEEVNN